MSEKRENSPLFRKIKNDLSTLKNFRFDIPKPPKYDLPEINLPDNFVTEEELTERQIKKQDEILEFLRTVTIEQSKTSKRQFFANLFLTIMTIIIGVIAIIPVFSGQNNTEYKTLYEHTLELEKDKLKQDLTISELSKNLVDLQNQVQTLEKQNEELSKIND